MAWGGPIAAYWESNKDAQKRPSIDDWLARPAVVDSYLIGKVRKIMKRIGLLSDIEQASRNWYAM